MFQEKSEYRVKKDMANIAWQRFGWLSGQAAFDLLNLWQIRGRGR